MTQKQDSMLDSRRLKTVISAAKRNMVQDMQDKPEHAGIQGAV